MNEWIRFGADQVRERTQKDLECQQVLCQVLEAEKEYLRIMDRLSKQEQDSIDHYIALCEELEYQKARLAYQCGKMCGK